MLIAIIRLAFPGFKYATSNTVRGRDGTAIAIFVTAVIILSAIPPKYPEIIAITVPIPVTTNAAKIPIYKDTLVP